MKRFQIKAKVISDYSFTINANSEREAALGARELIVSGYQTPHSEDMEIDCHKCEENKIVWVNRHEQY